jgi:hypothetical protein
MKQSHPFNNRWLKERLSRAINVLEAGPCWSCGAGKMYSFQLPGQIRIRGSSESCKFLCGNCGLLAAGTRKIA